MDRRRGHMGNWVGPILVPEFLQPDAPSANVSKAMTDLSFEQLCMVIEIHVAVRKDIDFSRLDRLSNALGLQAHMGARI